MNPEILPTGNAGAERVTVAVMKFFDDRKGFSGWWDWIDEETQREIVAELTATIEKAMG